MLIIIGCGVFNNVIIKDIVGMEVMFSIPVEIIVIVHFVVF